MTSTGLAAAVDAYRAGASLREAVRLHGVSRDLLRTTLHGLGLLRGAGGRAGRSGRKPGSGRYMRSSITLLPREWEQLSRLATASGETAAAVARQVVDDGLAVASQRLRDAAAWLTPPRPVPAASPPDATPAPR